MVNPVVSLHPAEISFERGFEYRLLFAVDSVFLYRTSA